MTNNEIYTKYAGMLSFSDIFLGYIKIEAEKDCQINAEVISYSKNPFNLGLRILTDENM